MCAVFGWFNPEFTAGVDKERLLRHLARKCQAYGEKSFGLAARKPGATAAVKLEVARYTGTASTWLEQNAKELKKWASAQVLLGHTRMPTHGAVTKLNAHPFPIGDWLVAHNGCISNSLELMRKALFVPKGETDSEEALCYVVGRQFSVESLNDIEGSFAFEAFSRNGEKALLICDGRQNLHVAKVGRGWVWCTDGDILASSLEAAGAAGLEVKRIQSQILDLVTGVSTPIESRTVWGSTYTARITDSADCGVSAFDRPGNVFDRENRYDGIPGHGADWIDGRTKEGKAKRKARLERERAGGDGNTLTPREEKLVAESEEEAKLIDLPVTELNGDLPIELQ